ncbi:MAG: hypothetical protein NXY57DRAFT_1034349 [Lentinula lateritia]|nr:MAG: hypothetical protein NXY57DRAFT_1034349 [Lentinula lateritia]
MDRRVKTRGLASFVRTTGNNFVSKLRRGHSHHQTAPAASSHPSILSDPLPFEVPKGCVTNGTKLRFADTRDPYLPAVYEVKSHPRIPKDLASNTIKRILVVPWPKGNAPYLKFYFNYCKANVPIPGSRNATIPSWGKLEVGDIVFVRDIAGSGDGIDDSFEVFVGDMCEDRSANFGTAFEQCTKRANPVGGSGRCYGCGLSHQKPRNLVTPAVGGKIPIWVATKFFRRLLPAEYKCLETACDLNNVPRIGTDDNVLYQGVQLNLSDPVYDTGVINFIKALAFFGGKHFDKHDSPGGWTTMFSYPDMPIGNGWEGGRFHLVELGLYAELDGLKSITFTGLRLHGGTPPLAPAGTPIPPWAYRWVVVLYPQGAILDGKATVNVAATSKGFPVQVIPAMLDAMAPEPEIENNNGSMVEEDEPEPLRMSARELNFLDDGKIVMTPQAEIDFLARSFFLHTLYNQKEISGGSLMKYETYRHGWSIKRDDDIIYYAGPWDLAPGNSDALLRQTAQVQWAQHCKQRLEIIPSALRNFNGPPIKIPPPRFLNNSGRAKRAIYRKTAASKINAKLKKGKAKTALSEIIDAANKAPQVVQEKSLVQMPAQPKRKSNAPADGERKSKRIRDRMNALHGTEPLLMEKITYELRSIYSHRVCTKACCSYEYFVEWDDGVPGTKEWIHEYQIDTGEMYSSYCRGAFAQVLDSKSYFLKLQCKFADRVSQQTYIQDQGKITIFPIVANQVKRLMLKVKDSNYSSSPHSQDKTTIPFIHNVTKDSLLFTIHLLNEGIAGKEEMDGTSIRGLFQKLNRFHAALETSPLESRTMKAAVDVWPSIALLLTDAKVHDASARLLHHTVMLSHYRLYTWVSESIERVLDYPSSNWWSRLIRAVAEVVELGVPGTFQFDSLEFFPAIDPPKSYTWLFQKRQNDQRTANTLLTSRIIFHWLGLPMESDDRHRVRSLFLKSVMDSCRTPSILLLDEVWNAYNAPSHLCSVGIKRALPSKSAMKKLERAFLEHPILGRERSSEIDELFTALHRAHRLFIGLSTTSSASSSGTLVPLP